MVRKFTKSKAVFPTDDSIRKVIYMSVREIAKKWTMPVHDWGLGTGVSAVCNMVRRQACVVTIAGK